MGQMAYIGPMLGQHHQFHHYNPGKSKFGEERYFKISKKIYEELDERLSKSKYLAGGEYSIADIAILPWTLTYQRQNVAIEDYPHVVAWREELGSRDAVVAGMKVGAEWRKDLKTLNAEDFAKLFGTK